jgi:hypothetical protein
MTKRSRLAKNFEKRSRNTLILSVLGIFAVLFLLFKYGIPLITETSYQVGQITNSQNNSKTQTTNNTYVAAPSLDSLPQAVNKPDLAISGTALTGLKIQLYVNGSQVDETNTDSNGTFKFGIQLSSGDNIIKARAVSGTNQSDFSDSSVVTYKNAGPSLTIDSPHDGDNISSGSSPINVTGKTDPDSMVTVNGFQAIIDQNGNYTYSLALNGGGNDIKVVSTDNAGNQTAKQVHINYSQ